MEWFIFAIFAAVFFGTRQVISKRVLLYEHATEYLTGVCLVTFLFSLFFYPFMRFDYSLGWWALMYLKALLLTVAWIMGAKALRHLEISYVVPLTNLAPMFLLVFSFFFLGEVPSVLQYIGVGLIIFGAYWLQSNHKWYNLIRPWLIFRNRYSVFMLGAIFLYSICAVVDKIALEVVNPYTYLSFTYLVVSTHYLLIQFYKYEGLKDIKHAFMNGKYLMVIIPLLMVFADVFYLLAVAVPGAMISLIIPVKRMSTLVATAIGGRLFHDHNIVHRTIASLIMIVGVVLIVI